MTILDVRPADRHGQYTAALDGRDLCTSRQPFLDAARVLLAEGLDPKSTLVMRWATTGTESLRSTIGYAAVRCLVAALADLHHRIGRC